jgi:hypothetical protein
MFEQPLLQVAHSNTVPFYLHKSRLGERPIRELGDLKNADETADN